ncbi:hypothetical protein OIV83_000696 [Microbotryomycetes sp. JL201]|nr:hypothetical protein OIV83_000696 [Microbotryomycetes sp. JL201]
MSDSDTLYDPPPRRSGNVGVLRSPSTASAARPSSRRNSVSTVVPSSDAGDSGFKEKVTRNSADENAPADANFSDQEVERIKRGAATRRLSDTDSSLSDAGTSDNENHFFDIEGRQGTPAGQSRLADRHVQKEGRRSKLQEMQEEPNYHPSAFMDHFHGDLFELTHCIDELENDIDQIVSIRNKIVTLSPKQDPDQKSLRAMLNGQASLVNDTGRRIVALEQWLMGLYNWMRDLRAATKRGETAASLQDAAEVKYQISSARLDFADAMSRVREGAWKEEERRERTRLWMARHMRFREPDWDDDQVRKTLKAAEIDSARGIGKNLQDVTSYAALFALRNPFTELAELTRGMDLMKEALDREIVDEVIHNKPPRSSVGSVTGGTGVFKYHVVDDKHLESLDFEYGFARGQRKQRELNASQDSARKIREHISDELFEISANGFLKRGLGLDKPMDKAMSVESEAMQPPGAMWSAEPQPTVQDRSLTFGQTIAAAVETSGSLDLVAS